MEWAIPLTAVVISVATFVVTQTGMKHKAEVDYVDRLENRMKKTEAELKECIEDRGELWRRLRALERRR
jgi:hypothetical protein